MTAADESTRVPLRADLATTTIEYDETDGTYRTEFDARTRLPSEAVVDAVAAATGRYPIDLPPLFSVLDPDALDTLFGPTPAGQTRLSPSITFEYATREVAVSGTGVVRVEPAE